MNNTKVIKNIIILAISNFIKLLAGVLVGFIIPKIMGETNYGYYKTFTLYLTYIGIFPLGFIDGIYLMYAGSTYDELDKRTFRTYTKFLMIFQSFISAVICMISIFFITTDYGFICFFIGLTLVINNIMWYYQFISQVTNRFKELSIRNTLNALMQIFFAVIFFVLWKFHIINELNYKYYIISYTFTLLLLTLWYIYTYKDITFGQKYKISGIKKSIFKMFKIGFPLMIANLTSSLILSIDRQYVNILVSLRLCTIEEYGIYSFAYQMLSLITTIIAAISTVLYPTIKVYTYDRLKSDYNTLITIIAMLTAFCLLAYQPLCFIVQKWLEEYSSSLQYFWVILPTLTFSSCISMIMFNYYKRLNKQFRFFITSLIILILSIVANVVFYSVFKNILWVSIASLVVCLIWYISTDIYLAKTFKIKTYKNFMYLILIIISYFFTTFYIKNIILSFVIYAFLFVMITLLFHHNLILCFFKRIKSK